MPEPIALNQMGVRLLYGRLYNHDYLWFSANEISGVSMSLPVLHNYALCYALWDHFYAAGMGSTPQYQQDLAGMSLYATAGEAAEAGRARITYNALDDRTLRTDTGPEANTPKLGSRVYLNPVYEGRDRPTPQQGYVFYAFTRDDFHLPGTTRLGKKRCPVRIRWEELARPLARLEEQAKPTHLLNPLDLSPCAKVVGFDVVSIPPHLLLRNATIANDWF
ncbi:MAG: type I-D CRISPR-associated protein Cas5/Csc1, partial [Chloroflexi bacterium]|nr:type I-D CRISPR-associated protein Cas5/Csc1 [Chloroflexota bacterium]